MMGKTISWGLACALGFVCGAAVAAEEGKNVWEEYGKRVERSASVSALGSDLFGDQVSMSDGSLSFSVTDVSLSGNNALPVAFTRTFTVRNNNDPLVYNDFPMEDWEIDLPNISGVFAHEWIVSNTETPYKRCSVAPDEAGRPPAVWVGEIKFESKDYWQGHNLSLPGGGGGELLLLPDGRPRPTTGGPYHWVTNDQTRVACLPSVKNWSGGGEGFLAITPDGTRYWFDWMAQTKEPELIGTKSHIVTPSPNKHVIYIEERQARRRNSLYATRVQDRFGNTVEYTYTNAPNQPVRLERIKSSDGRQIDIAYNTPHGAVSTVSDGSRVWQYRYAGVNSFDHTLTGVIQPDGSQWSIAFAGLLAANVEYQVTDSQELESRSCTSYPAVAEPRVFHGSATHPSGATGEFTVNVVAHGRTNVPVLCDNFDSVGNIKSDDLAIWPIYHHGLSLAKKRITGPGLEPLEWNYSYYSPRSFYYPGGASEEFPVCTDSSVDCSTPRCVSDDCPGPKSTTTTVTDAKGNWIRHSYGNSYRYNEGKLLNVEVGSGTAPALRSTVKKYDLSQSDKAYPARFGISPRTGWEGFTSAYHRPQVSQTIHQDGATFSSTTTSFDQFARPLGATEASSTGFSRTRNTVYHDNLAAWVLGQTQKSSVNGVVTDQASFDATTAMPVQRWSFGKLQHTLGYNIDGTFATVKDGRNLITTLSNWKRGIPQSILHADGTAQSAVVDDRGWMSSMTDENGFKTCYTYDVMGRTSTVTYPSETVAGACDTSAWNQTRQEFAKINGIEWDIPAGHWRQTIINGDGRRQLYFDALWRPILTREFDATSAASTDATTRFTRRAFDESGREAFASYPGSTHNPVTGTWTLYDALGRVTSSSQDSELGLLISRTEYLPGFQTRTTNPRGHSTTTTIYQAYDQPSYDLPRGIEHPEGAYTEIFRDVFGKPTQVRRRDDGTLAATRWYVYNSRQELCKTIEPETGSTVFGYDGAGNLQWSGGGVPYPDPTNCESTTPRGSLSAIERTYDARNRLATMTMSDGNGSQQWSYAPDGLPTKIVTYNDAGTTTAENTYAYNSRRLMTVDKLEQPGWYLWSIGSSYDANGALASHTYPSGQSVSYAPNALGQPTRAGTYASGVSYHANGALKQFTYGNGLVHTMTQNARQLPHLVNDSGNALAHRYVYDGNANPMQIYDDIIGTATQQHRYLRYDGLDRLTGAGSQMFGGDHWHHYTYDVLDNITSWTQNSLNGAPPVKDYAEYVYDGSSRLTNIRNSAGGSIVGLGYDVQGNLSAKNGQAYQFDYGNRLRAVSASNTPIETYRYDGHGRRIQNTNASTGTLLSTYSADGKLMYHRDVRSGKNSRTDYIYLGGSQVAQREQNLATGVVTVKYQHTDALGSPVAVSDAAGAVIERTKWEPYGAAIGKTVDGVGYTGHVMDGATGLTYMQQRYYDPGIGRFLSVDPVTANSNTGGNFNRYWYANNNPYAFMDPDGREACGTDTTCRISSGASAGTISGAIAGANGSTFNRSGSIITDRASGQPTFNVPASVANRIPNGMIRGAYNDLQTAGASDLEHGTVGYVDGDEYSSEAMPAVSRGEIGWSLTPGDPRLSYLSHTHGNGKEWYHKYFSRDDTRAGNDYDLPVFLSNRSAEFRVFVPGSRTGGKVPEGKLQYGQSPGLLLCVACMPTR